MIKDILAFLGAICLLVSIITVVWVLFSALCLAIEQAKYKYRYKHRFDKPPTAKCYCRDCRRHSDETNLCYKFDPFYTADNWFCWDAEPRDMKFEKVKD